MSRPAKYILRQPNRGLLRKLGFTQALGGSAAAVTPEALRSAGIKDIWVEFLASEQRVCASNAAVYLFRGQLSDRLARMARKHPAMTVGLTTALWLANVLPERPSTDHWMIAEAKRRPIWLPPDVRVHRSRHAAHDTFATVLAGEAVNVHTPLRAMLDCVRFRRELGRDVVLEALRAVVASGVVALPVLLARATTARVRKPLLRLLIELGHVTWGAGATTAA